MIPVAETKTIVEVVNLLVQTVALLGAAGYFGYRFITGYFIVNLSLSLSASRRKSPNPGEDFLSVAVTLTKGDRGSLNLHDAKLRVTWEGGEVIHDLPGIDRRNYLGERLGSFERKTINFAERAAYSPFLRLTPGEEAVFSAYVKVPSASVCYAEVIILGERRWGKRRGRRVGQWRSSILSFPESARPIDGGTEKVPSKC
jgi:hypothetical protein